MFSVVIPLYNKEQFIQRAVESVLSQNYTDFELIVVNDGSTDKSLEKLKDITDSRIKIINQENAGVGAARNKGIESASYDWIALLDADDMWAVNHLKELRKIIEAYPLSGMVSSQVSLQDTNTKLKASDVSINSNIREIDYFKQASINLSIVHSSSVCINKKVFKEIGGFTSNKMGEDLEYWARIALNYPVAISDVITAYYMRGTGGVTENQDTSTYKKLDRLKDVSPSINLIIEKSKHDSSLLKQPGIISYINSRLFSGVKSWLYQGNIPAAKNLSKLALPQKDPKYIILSLVTKLPESILRALIKSYKLAR